MMRLLKNMAYGYAQTIFNTLNALAMVRNSSLWPAMITTISLMVGTYYAWRMAGSRQEGHWRQYLMQVFGMIILINALLIPKQTMYIKDHVEKHYWKVDNIPLAFALPVGAVEQLGHLITMVFEQSFNLVAGRSSFNYYHYGTVFGARLGKEVMESKVRDPEFVSNMHNFMKRCVILPAMIGHQFTKEELVSTKDIWGLVSKNAGTFARTDMIINGVKQRPAPTCKQAVPYFEEKFDYEGRKGITALSWKFKAAGDSNEYNQKWNQLNANLEKQILALYQDRTKVDTILKHNMMINALNDYRAGKFPSVRAQLQHEAGGLISGDLADHILTGLLSVMKNLLYGSFIFIVPLMLMAGGIGKYRMWITLCLSLQLWPALFAMLNMMIDFAYDPATIVSYSGWSTERKKFDSMASIAANMTLVIPFLAVWVTRMGEGGFLHLAGNIMASASGAVSAAASEKATGSKSWDNENTNNSSHNNENSNKVNTSREYVSGGNGFMHADGSMERTTPGGEVIRVGGAGSSASTGESSYSERDGVDSTIHNSIRDEQTAMVSEMASLNKSKEQVETFEAQAAYQIAENTRTDSGYNIDTSTESGKELVKGFNEIDRINKTNDYGWQQNAKAYAKANASFGSALQGLLGFGASAEVGGEIGADNISSQNDVSTLENANETNLHDRSGTSERINKNDAILESAGIDKTQLESARSAYNESTRLEESIAGHKDEIQAWSNVREQTEVNGSESRKEMFPEVVKGLRERYGYDRSQAWKAASQRTPEAQSVFKDLTNQKALSMKAELQAGRDQVASTTVTGDIRSEETQLNKNPGQSAIVQGFKGEHNMTSGSEVERQVADQAERLQGSFYDKYDSNIGSYEDAEIGLKAKQEQKRAHIDKLEEDRIGKGDFAKGIGYAVDFATFRNSGEHIGRPPEEPMPEFEPIMRRYGEKELISSIHEVPRKASESAPEDSNAGEAQDLTNQFSSTSDVTGNRSGGDGQKVTPKNKTKG